ncbi:hypothetical protein X777_15402, partial [Ooceraea biroi]
NNVKNVQNTGHGSDVCLPHRSCRKTDFFWKRLQMEFCVVKSDRTPNPGPGGGVVNDVSPPAGSAANLGAFCGPGGGLSPFLKAFIIAVAVSVVKSSCERKTKGM